MVENPLFSEEAKQRYLEVLATHRCGNPMFAANYIWGSTYKQSYLPQLERFREDPAFVEAEQQAIQAGKAFQKQKQAQLLELLPQTLGDVPLAMHLVIQPDAPSIANISKSFFLTREADPEFYDAVQQQAAQIRKDVRAKLTDPQRRSELVPPLSAEEIDILESSADLSQGQLLQSKQQGGLLYQLEKSNPNLTFWFGVHLISNGMWYPGDFSPDDEVPEFNSRHRNRLESQFYTKADAVSGKRESKGWQSP